MLEDLFQYEQNLQFNTFSYHDQHVLCPTVSYVSIAEDENSVLLSRLKEDLVNDDGWTRPVSNSDFGGSFEATVAASLFHLGGRRQLDE